MSNADRSENPLTVDQMVKSFNWFLSPRRQEILNGFNQALMRLYAGIGKTCIAYLQTKDFKTADEGLQHISGELVPRYGEIFNVSQLKLMMLLAPHHNLPNRRASLLCALPWEMTSVLLPVTDAAEQEFYLRAAVAENWSLSDLTKNIYQNTYQNPALFKTLRARIARYAVSSGKQKNQLERQLKIAPLLEDYLKRRYNNPFVEPLLTLYKPLLQPQPNEPACTYKQFRDAIDLNNVEGIIAQIVSFRRDVFEHINSQFNEMYRIAGEVLNNNKHHHPASFTALLHYVKNQYGYLFDDDDIEAAMQLNSEPKNFHEVLHIMRLISWPHIKLLAPLKNINEKLFYAELTHEDDLRPEELQQRIESNWYEQALAKYNEQHEPADAAQKKRKRIEKTVTGNITMVVEHIAINENDIRPFNHHLNILQNPYFMQFMAMPLP